MGHWTEDEAKAYGLIKDRDGNWHQPQKPSNSVRNPSPMPEPQPPVRRQRKEPDKDEAVGAGMYEIRVVSYRHRHADPDNLCAKVWIDLLVEMGVLPDDSSRFVERVIKQVVVRKNEPETTEIEIWKLIP